MLFLLFPSSQAMENMRSVLSAANSSFPQVVKTTILLADIKDFPKVNEAYGACQKKTNNTNTHDTT